MLFRRSAWRIIWVCLGPTFAAGSPLQANFTRIPQGGDRQIQEGVATNSHFLAAQHLTERSSPLNCNPPPCFSCNTHNQRTGPILYTKAMADGLGSVIVQLANAQGIASKLGWRFGGAIGGSGKSLKRHVANDVPAVKMIFGNGSEIRPPNLPAGATTIDLQSIGKPWTITTKMNSTFLQAWAQSLPPAPNGIYHIPESSFSFSPEVVDFFLDEPFLDSLRRTALCGVAKELEQDHIDVEDISDGPTAVSPPSSSLASSSWPEQQHRVRVVVHYRRGDTDFSSGFRKNMATHPEWYFKIIGSLKKLFPDAQLRAFTSCRGAAQCALLNSVDVPHWKAHGIFLHVDDEGGEGNRGLEAHTASNEDMKKIKSRVTKDWMNTFAQFARADVLIMAKSMYSLAGAYFNGNCVLSPIESPGSHRIRVSKWILVAEPPPGEHHDMSYTKIDQPLDYHTHYNDSMMEVVGQNPAFSFDAQLRRSLAPCLPSHVMAMETPELASGDYV
mmetsp:Transcript_29557/g.53526  ORF Transcript_29557/g.53526 Transcript_29557/m.53526 type:complete len:500 (+) Transcript_29557:99-1598(+)